MKYFKSRENLRGLYEIFPKKNSKEPNLHTTSNLNPLFFTQILKNLGGLNDITFSYADPCNMI